jgi:poly [ADP-ribose] polymerase
MGSFNSMKTINPIDYIYNTINCKLHYMNENELETQYILRYIWSSVNNFDKTNSKMIEIERIFKFECLGGGGDEELTIIKDSPLKTVANKNRYLLWHGTGTENMLSIMSKGLIKCPPDTRRNGCRYGKGIYTSDVFTMSANYSHGKIETCESTKEKYERKYMLLCEVTLGNIFEIKNYQVIENAPDGYDSVKAFGNYEPNEQYTIQLPNGAKLPLGNLIESKLNESNLNKKFNQIYDQFNQYIVYDESQVCVRYIVQFRQKV